MKLKLIAISEVWSTPFVFKSGHKMKLNQTDCFHGSQFFKTFDNMHISKAGFILLFQEVDRERGEHHYITLQWYYLEDSHSPLFPWNCHQNVLCFSISLISFWDLLEYASSSPQSYSTPLYNVKKYFKRIFEFMSKKIVSLS